MKNDTIKFTKINNWYQNKIGKLIPSKSLNNSMVFSNDDIKTNDYERNINMNNTSESLYELSSIKRVLPL